MMVALCCQHNSVLCLEAPVRCRRGFPGSFNEGGKTQSESSWQRPRLLKQGLGEVFLFLCF